MIVRLFLLAFLSVSAPGSPLPMADQGQVPPDFALAKALPQEIAGWKKSREDQVFNRDGIFDYLDGAGELYLAFDFRFVFVREFATPDAPSIVVEIYQMSSSEDAYGVFTQDTDGREIRLGQDGLYAAGLVRFWKGKVFVRIMADRETPEARDAVLKLGETIDAAVPEAGPKPALLRSLPVEGLEPRTVRFFHTVISLNSFAYMSNVNILNLSPETQVAMARYEEKGAHAALILIEYPSTAAAYSAEGRFVEMYLLQRFIPEAKPRPLRLENGKYAGLVLTGSYLAIVVEADNPAVAERLLARVAKNL
jgi:hypothetical protein